MESIEVRGINRKSTIMIGERLAHLEKYIPAEKVVLITDSNVWGFYRKDFPPHAIIQIGTGETIKQQDTVRDIYEKLIELEADRSVFIVGIGGGIVCDITGFAASTYLRGVKFGFVSTTLLSQVDASVGGKNGVNFKGFKNIIGTFNQPEFVICDIHLLKTLPEREVLCGLAEIVKHAALGDSRLFSFLEEYHQKALHLDKDVIKKLVYDSIRLKSSIVSRDEMEKGERKKLNFGHTFGHAIEKTAQLPHGEAVSIGMVIASRLSVNKGLLSAAAAERVEGLLIKLKLPTRLDVDKEKVLDALKMDKKREAADIHFVLLRDIGDAVIEKIPISDLEIAMKDLF